MGIPCEDYDELDFVIRADNRKKALIERFNNEPEHVFNARVRAVTEESTEGDMSVKYTITSEFGNLYIDKEDDDGYEILKLFNSVDELYSYLKEA